MQKIEKLEPIRGQAYSITYRAIRISWVMRGLGKKKETNFGLRIIITI